MDAGEIIKDVADAAPTALKIIELGVELLREWTNAPDGDAKAAAEARAQACVASMNDAGNDEKASHEKLMAELDAKLGDKPAAPALIVPDDFDRSDVKP